MNQLGLIGGSGLDAWGEPSDVRSIDTPFGAPSGALQFYSGAKLNLIFLPRHGENHSIAPHRINYRANVHALAAQSPATVLAVNAVGSLDECLLPGSLVLPDQLIDYSWGRASSFFDGDAGALAHIDFTHPFHSAYRARVLEISDHLGIPVANGGCLGVTQGPRLETAAEIRRMSRDGCDLVGMTSLPEAALAREAHLDYLCIAVVANAAAGMAEGTLEVAQMELVLEQGMANVRRIIMALMDSGL